MLGSSCLDLLVSAASKQKPVRKLTNQFRLQMCRARRGTYLGCKDTLWNQESPLNSPISWPRRLVASCMASCSSVSRTTSLPSAAISPLALEKECTILQTLILVRLLSLGRLVCIPRHQADAAANSSKNAPPSGQPILITASPNVAQAVSRGGLRAQPDVPKSEPAYELSSVLRIRGP